MDFDKPDIYNMYRYELIYSIISNSRDEAGSRKEKQELTFDLIF